MVHSGVASEAGFRSAVCHWLRANVPAEPRPPITRDGVDQAGEESGGADTTRDDGDAGRSAGRFRGHTFTGSPSASS